MYVLQSVEDTYVFTSTVEDTYSSNSRGRITRQLNNECSQIYWIEKKRARERDWKREIYVMEIYVIGQHAVDNI